MTAGRKPIGKAATNEVGLPPVIFLYTLDQIAGMIGISEDSLRAQYLYYVGRTPGMKLRHQMEAVNIAAEPEDRPDWRVSLDEFVRWLKRMGFKISGLSYLA